MNDTSDPVDFRSSTRVWLKDHCPPSMRTRMVSGEDIASGSKRRSTNPEAYLWLEAKSISIAGGSNEIQLNIIAKRVLGLPD
ncbi:MAG: acyl-CoA dehydrogenase family protein [Pseudomonadales bacterium]|jgi:hypothetical protein|nr:acyl-CoA dehydrogenase family protein [Pseudomonadales bacterium]MDP6472152.1 acyl-CoA dehydrogenase family protein [Pseudomonadales bacterium]MDP6826596.1 acyl-CoA dehydrogenase family protein [Pseudomonadales bacterium]MDP6970133.1 acyl-CoA dehydrogenase family protein [Pseudomonadales bacterium]|tara:strand:- start:2782 stop:3027 length:246 start_codon:yes stop_codon:yes gene_type:complete